VLIVYQEAGMLILQQIIVVESRMRRFYQLWQILLEKFPLRAQANAAPTGLKSNRLMDGLRILSKI
jgi:hypothetical protein